MGSEGLVGGALAQRVNLADDAAYTARARELRGMMEEWFGRYVEPDTDGLNEEDVKEG